MPKKYYCAPFRISKLKQSFLAVLCLTFFSSYIPVSATPQPEMASYLNADDLSFLSNIKVIRKCVDPNRMPLEGINESSQHVGVIADILKFVEQKIGIPIKLVPTNSWTESLEKLKARECDMITSDAVTGASLDYYQQTVPFLHLRNAYITRNSSPFELDFSAIIDKPIGIPKNYPTIKLIKAHYGNVNLVEVEDTDEGLLKVSQGELYAFTGLLPVCGYSMQKQGLTNLKVAGHVDIPVAMVMGVRSDMPQLVQILNKTLATIDQRTYNQFLSHWIKIEYDVKVDWKFLAKYLIAIIIIAGAILYWNRKLGQVNRKLDKANAELMRLNETDTLTKMKNRNFLSYKLPELIKLANRNHLSLGIAMLDIDHFKRLNDTFGHAVGDKCLTAFADKVHEVFRRESDWGIRYGGEEFVLICLGVPVTEFVQGLEKLRREVASLSLQLESGEKVVYTVSIGYTFHTIAPKIWDENLIIEADKKLYQAKSAGRNCVVG